MLNSNQTEKQSNIQKKYNWLFVVQNFEIKSYHDSSAKIEVVEPILASGFVKRHKVMCFDRDYQHHYQTILTNSVEEIYQKVCDSPLVVYGAGIHSEQHLELYSNLNIVAFADRDEKLWGKHLAGIPIISPDQMEHFAKHVMISSKAYEESIYSELNMRFPSLVLHKLYHQEENNKVFNKDMALVIEHELSNTNYDILFYCPTHPSDCLSADYWQQLKRKAPKCKFVSLWWDYDEQGTHSPYLQFERDCLLWSDLCIENSNVTRLNKMQYGEDPYQDHHNVAKVIFHPTIFSPALFYFDPTVIKDYEIALFGSAAGERKQWIDFLQAEFPDNFSHIGGVLHGESTLSIEQYAQALRKTKICINTQTYSAREQCKGKVREALACGVLLLEQDNLQTRQLLNEGEGVLYFSTPEQLQSQLKILLAEPAKIVEIVEKGQEVWQKKMTSYYWTNTLLSTLFFSATKS